MTERKEPYTTGNDITQDWIPDWHREATVQLRMAHHHWFLHEHDKAITALEAVVANCGRMLAALRGNG